jgi:hypothetical protein
MKSKATLTLLALLLLMLATYTPIRSTQAATTGKPKLVIESLEHSFGKIVPGTPLTYTFKVRNVGDVDLEIKNVSPSCGCTAANFDKLIATGKEGSITLKIENTASYQGEIVKTATVTTNDPAQQNFTLTLRANFTKE